MTDSVEVKQLKSALGLGVSVLTAEHFFSAGLSSPYTTQKLAQGNPTDAKIVWELFWEASIASMGLAFMLTILLKDPWAVIGTVGIIIMYYYEYKNALEGKIGLI